MLIPMPGFNFYLRLSLVVTLVGTLGGLYFSEIAGFPPCVLCWYQRICMYPLVFIFASALWFEDRRFGRYVFPLAITGFVIALYHNLLYYGAITQEIVPCDKGLSCTTKQVEWLGFITIPLMSLVGFSLIIALSYLASTSSEERKT